MATGLVYSSAFLEHDPGPVHPESPQRLRAIHRRLEAGSYFHSLVQLDPGRGDRSLVEKVHTPAYVERVQTACERGDPFIDTPDCGISTASFQVALTAAQASSEAVAAVLAARVDNALVLPRPPGHHAEKGLAMGFCLFNNVAIAARYAQESYDLNRIAIIDFDVHHGNGTQHIFENDPTVLYLSLHRYPFYPGSGADSETGQGAGRGYTVNYPLPAGEGDATYLDIIGSSAADIILRYEPELIILSAGFDAHEKDPLGGMKLTTVGYHQMSVELVRLAGEACDGRLVSVLEGGYNLAALAESVEAHLQVLMSGVAQ